MRECDDQYPWLGEFLCEYVDGTMDPAVHAAFEECLRGDAHLADHVGRLVQARRALCRYGCRVQAPCDLHEALHRRIAGEAILAGCAHPAPAPTPTPAPTPEEAAGYASLRAASLLALLCAVTVAFVLAPAEGSRAQLTASGSDAFADPSFVHPAVAARAAREPVHPGDFRAPTRADSVRFTLRAAAPFGRRAARFEQWPAEEGGFQTASDGVLRLRAAP